mmetsp:Transcript_19790/g.61789  ORF Transcript_19790/g.61789 Transcript_19790/m.61789 type:complete len:433 (+) Transcript_19790:997-2295(+)
MSTRSSSAVRGVSSPPKCIGASKPSGSCSGVSACLARTPSCGSSSLTSVGSFCGTTASASPGSRAQPAGSALTSSSRWSTRRTAAAAVAAAPLCQPARPPAVGDSVDAVSQRAATILASSGFSGPAPASGSGSAERAPLEPLELLAPLLAPLVPLVPFAVVERPPLPPFAAAAAAAASDARRAASHGCTSWLPVRSSASPRGWKRSAPSSESRLSTACATWLQSLAAVVCRSRSRFESPSPRTAKCSLPANMPAACVRRCRKRTHGPASSGGCSFSTVWQRKTACCGADAAAASSSASHGLNFAMASSRTLAAGLAAAASALMSSAISSVSPPLWNTVSERSGATAGAAAGAAPFAAAFAGAASAACSAPRFAWAGATCLSALSAGQSFSAHGWTCASMPSTSSTSHRLRKRLPPSRSRCWSNWRPTSQNCS